MSEMRYEPVMPLSREEMHVALGSGDPRTMHDALISAAYWEDDWEWAQQCCVSYSDHPSKMVSAACAYGFGLIAVFHAKLDMDVVLPILERLRQDPATASFAEDSLEDINHFIVTLKGKHTARRLPASWRP